jgi:hypothetical protein
MRTLAWILLALFALVALGAALAEKPEVKQATGEVTFVCPQHKAIKLKADDKELMLWVYQKCPKKQELTEKIKGLEVGQQITVSYFQCPNTKKLYLTKVEEPEPET